MKNMRLSVLLSLAMAAASGACAVEPGALEGANEGGEPGADSTSEIFDAALSAELESKVNAYANALLHQDSGATAQLVSGEVHLRAQQMNSDMTGFAKKMGTSLDHELRQRNLDPKADITGAFTVDRIVREGDALRVDVSIDGAKTGKPFYFVSEDGEYKVNVRRPGFSNPLPEGAEASRDTYSFMNVSLSNVNFSCQGTASFKASKGTCRTELPEFPDENTPPPDTISGGRCRRWECTDYILFTSCDWELIDPDATYTSRKCDSTCGWWTGTTVKQGANSKKCDYNTFGADVIVNSNNTWQCNDEC